MSGLVSWLNLELWGPIWPNLAASTLCATAAVLRIRVHLARHHKELALQHDKARRMVAGLHDRLDALNGNRGSE